MSIGKGNKVFFVRVWKPLPSRRVLKTLRGSSKGVQIGQFLLQWARAVTIHISLSEGKLEKETPKRTISASGGLELLQSISLYQISICYSF